MLDSIPFTEILAGATLISKTVLTILSMIFWKLYLYVIFCAVAFYGGRYVYKFLKNYWVESQPNQWLLVTRDGKLLTHKSGIGRKTWIGFSDTVIRFPSRIQSVYFEAENVTKQMQGVKITGYAFWSVSTQEKESPLKCYKYMQGGDANGNVRAICESQLRSLIANSSLQHVLRNRNQIRATVKTDLTKIFKGWGVFLQSIQITTVKIQSDKLFSDLQAEFRQQVRYKAETIQIQSKQKIQQIKQNSQMKMSELTDGVNTKKTQTRNNEELKRNQINSDFQDKKNLLQLRRLNRENKYQLSKISNNLEIQSQKLSNDQLIKDMNNQFQLSFMKQKMDLDKLHDEKTLKIYQINVLASIYDKLPIKEVKINNFSGQSKTNLSSLLPAIGLSQVTQA